jgi:hypothetical protein
MRRPGREHFEGPDGTPRRRYAGLDSSREHSQPPLLLPLHDDTRLAPAEFRGTGGSEVGSALPMSTARHCYDIPLDVDYVGSVSRQGTPQPDLPRVVRVLVGRDTRWGQGTCITGIVVCTVHPCQWGVSTEQLWAVCLWVACTVQRLHVGCVYGAASACGLRVRCSFCMWVVCTEQLGVVLMWVTCMHGAHIGGGGGSAFWSHAWRTWFPASGLSALIARLR